MHSCEAIIKNVLGSIWWVCQAFVLIRIQYNTNTITIIGNVLGSMWWVCQAFVPRTLQFCAKSRQQTLHQYFQYFETFGTRGRHNNKKLNLKFWQYFQNLDSFGTWECHKNNKVCFRLIKKSPETPEITPKLTLEGLKYSSEVQVRL